MWTDETRRRHDRGGLRYTHDLTDAEWAEIEPLIPPARRGGNKRTVNAREVVNGLMYILGTGCQWRDIPKDLPPRSTLHDYLDRWSYDGTLDAIHHALYVKCQEPAERVGLGTGWPMPGLRRGGGGVRCAFPPYACCVCRLVAI